VRFDGGTERRAAGNGVDRLCAFSSGSVSMCVGFTFGVEP
jgi:hypothetical protein